MTLKILFAIVAVVCGIVILVEGGRRHPRHRHRPRTHCRRWRARRPMIEAAPAAATCPCARRHSPPAIVIEEHHVLPLSWGGPDVPANKVAICAQTHFTTHALLNLYVPRGRRTRRGDDSAVPPVRPQPRRAGVAATHPRPPNPLLVRSTQ